MKIYQAVIILLHLIACLVAIPAETANRALLIGVGDYADDRISDLPGIDLDLQNVKSIIKDLGFKDTEIKMLFDKDATLSNVRSALSSWMVEGMSYSDQALVYFSGHGSQIPDQDGDETEDHRDEVLVMYDTRVSKKTLTDVLVDDEFGQLLANIPAEKTIVLIDACHSGSATKSLSVRGNGNRNDPEDDGRVVKFLDYPGLHSVKAKELSGAKRGFTVEIAKRNTANHRFAVLSAARDDESSLASPDGSLFTLGAHASIKKAVRDGSALTLAALRDASQSFIDSEVTDPARKFHPVLSVPAGDSGDSWQVIGAHQPPGGDESSPMKRWERIVDSAGQTLDLELNQRSFMLGDEMRLTCKSPAEGYLYMISIMPDQQAVILLPNKFRKNNRVQANETIRIPDASDDFVLRASPPAGQNLIAVVLCPHELNLPPSKEIFDELNGGEIAALEKNVRGITVEGKQQGIIAAAKVMIVIEN